MKSKAPNETEVRRKKVEKAGCILVLTVFDRITGKILDNRNLMEFHKIDILTFQVVTSNLLSVEILQVEVLSSEISSAICGDDVTAMWTRCHHVSIQWLGSKGHRHRGCYGARNC